MPCQATHGSRELVHRLHVPYSPAWRLGPCCPSGQGSRRPGHLLALAGQVVVQDSCTDRWHTEALQCRYTYRKMEHSLKSLRQGLETGDILVWYIDPSQELSPDTAASSLPLFCPSRAEKE